MLKKFASSKFVDMLHNNVDFCIDLYDANQQLMLKYVGIEFDTKSEVVDLIKNTEAVYYADIM